MSESECVIEEVSGREREVDYSYYNWKLYLLHTFSPLLILVYNGVVVIVVFCYRCCRYLFVLKKCEKSYGNATLRSRASAVACQRPNRLAPRKQWLMCSGSRSQGFSL